MSASSTTRQNSPIPGTGPPPIFRLRLLGHMAVDDTLDRVTLPRTRKTRALMAILALASPRPVMRSTLTALLWSQRAKEQARASLRQSVHELQDMLGPSWGRLLHAERDQLALHGVGLMIDAQRVEAATLQQFQHPLLEDLTGLDPSFDRWLGEERGRLRQAALEVGEGLLAEQPASTHVVALAEQLLSIDRGHEGVWRTLIRYYANAGDRGGALRIYDRCRKALMERGAGGPSPETEDLLARIGGLDAERSFGAPHAEPISGQSTNVRLAVLPLRLLDSAHPGNADGLALGLAEELTTSLARFRWISCVSANSYATAEASAPAVGWHVGNTDFVLDGTIQRGGQRVRILMRIVDMRSGGEVVWACRFDRESADVLALQDDLVAEIVAQVEPELLLREGERVSTRSLPTRFAPTLVLRAVPAIYRLDRAGFEAAGAMLEEALAVDPNYASAHAWYAYWHLFLVGQGWAKDPDAATRRGEALAERAVMLDPSDARALTLAGHVRGFLGKRPREACLLHDRAIALNPNLALAWSFSGLALCYLGQHEDALIRMRQAIRMSPSDPHSFFFDNAMQMPHLLLGNYEKSVEFGRRAIEFNPGFSSSFKLYLSALGHLGRLQEAAKVRTRLLTLEQGFSVSSAIARSPLTQPEDLACYAQGLRLAGLAEESRGALIRTIDLMPAPQHSQLQRGITRAGNREIMR